ncbi:hypothetical protein [Algibacillus agarilyticus]|uniref:hypothetical protein n=1 Tax=Algibacillus agarilyticus TaxID=2234133 RepID=UPI000DD0DE3A|nr:hypothetical protein [Algibacillus agarilyticus]
MKYSLPLLLFFTFNALGCGGKSIIPINLQVETFYDDKVTFFEVNVKAPLKFKGYEYTHSIYLNDYNQIPIGAQEDKTNNIAYFYAEGTQSFFEKAQLLIFYKSPSGGEDKGLCVGHSETLDWNTIKEEAHKNT